VIRTAAQRRPEGLMVPRSRLRTWAVRHGRRSAPARLPRRLTAYAHQPPLT
jgi:hypothetical protein